VITDSQGHVIGALQFTALPTDLASSRSWRLTHLYEEWNRVVETSSTPTTMAASVVTQSTSVAASEVAAPAAQTIEVEVWGFSQQALSGTEVLSATSPIDGLAIYLFIVGNTEVIARPATPANNDAVQSFLVQFIATNT
jgi:hypothetical protein